MRIQALICVIIIFLGCKPAEIPKDVGSLSGSVFYKNRFGTMPDAGAVVTIYQNTDSGANSILSLYTDVSGRFETDSLEVGSYIILVKSNSEKNYPFLSQLTDLYLSLAMLNRIYPNMPHEQVFNKHKEIDSIQTMLVLNIDTTEANFYSNLTSRIKTRDSLEKEAGIFIEGGIIPDEIIQKLGLGWGRFSKRFKFSFLTIEKDKKAIENIEIR